MGWNVCLPCTRRKPPRKTLPVRLSLLFPSNRGKEQGPPPPKKKKQKRYSPILQHKLYHLPLKVEGEQYLEFMGNLSGSINGRVSSEAVLSILRADVWWYFGGPLLCALAQQLEQNLRSDITGYPFHFGIS
uniref:Uncharacterized protein n=1 Tax=Myotis myotis TaxID=51298 RepID=A0A7J7ZXC3_MYOMY|nr:hypothetical protein mMyoMyo1_009825 [Myotis myotis]